MTIEQRSPVEASLNTAIHNQSDTIRSKLLWLFAKQGDILNPDLEFSSSEKLQGFRAYARGFAYLLADPTEPTRTNTHTAIYRAMCFANQIATWTMSTKPVYAFGRYTQELLEKGDPALWLATDAAEYLQQRPDIDRLLQGVSRPIAQSSDTLTQAISLTMGAITFKLAEQSQTERHSEDTWDGIIQ